MVSHPLIKTIIHVSQTINDVNCPADSVLFQRRNRGF